MSKQTTSHNIHDVCMPCLKAEHWGVNRHRARFTHSLSLGLPDWTGLWGLGPSLLKIRLHRWLSLPCRGQRLGY